MPIRSASWAGMIGRTRLELASQSGLFGFKPRASADCATVRYWCEAPESNREAPNFEYGRYANSLQLRVNGAFPGIRTRNNWSLKPARLPVAPDQEPQATQDSRRLVPSTARDARSAQRRGLVPTPGFEPGNPCF